MKPGKSSEVLGCLVPMLQRGMHSHSAVVAIGYYGEVCRWSMGTRKTRSG